MANSESEDPREDHFRFVGSGLEQDDDPTNITAGTNLLKETSAKNTPCPFHDGVSGSCWKGVHCVYSHKLYTGGEFTAKHAEIALAAENQAAVTSVTQLPCKAHLNKEAEIHCKVTYVDHPFKFFIRPLDGNINGDCSCTKVNDWFEVYKKLEDANPLKKKDMKKDKSKGIPCDKGGQKPHDGQKKPLLPNPKPKHTETETIDEKLNNYMKLSMHYVKLQKTFYFPLSELVAVRVSDTWYRALVQPYIVCDSEKEPIIRAQLLETGEIVAVTGKNICSLPPQFCDIPTTAFQCAIFGVSPVWDKWSSSCVKSFRELVLDKELRIIVKIVPLNQGAVTVFENPPYIVKVMVKDENEKCINVAQKIAEMGQGIAWNPVPLRPFMSKVIDTKMFHFLHKSGKKSISNSTLELEEKRLRFLDEDTDNNDK